MSNFYDLCQTQIKCLNALHDGSKEEFEELRKNLPVIKLSEEQRNMIMQKDREVRQEYINIFKNL